MENITFWSKLASGEKQYLCERWIMADTAAVLAVGMWLVFGLGCRFRGLIQHSRTGLVQWQGAIYLA